jgi:glycerol-3-phosphate dehydrogenase (NAD(P)+)
MPKRIVIIGQGPAGKAVLHLLKKTKHKVSIECWDIDIKVCPARKPLETILPKADVLFLCIPSWAIRAAAHDLGSLIKAQTPIVSVSKGLDRTSEKTIGELLKEVFPSSKHIALLSGPMLATELLEGNIGAAVIASPSKSVQEELKAVFKGTKLRITTSNDIQGTALCGILKNIYSIGLGIAQALHPGDNFRGIFAQETVDEMTRIVIKLGGKKETVYSYAGIGDLIATGFSKHSKNHTYGRILVETGKKPDFDSEGSVSVGPLAKKLGIAQKDFPIFKTIHDIVLKKKNPKTILHLT